MLEERQEESLVLSRRSRLPSVLLRGVMEAMRAELSVAEICRKYSIADAQFYKWNKEFLEAGKKRLAGDTTREATSDEVAELRKENQRLKEIVADLVLRYDIVKKPWTFWNNRQVQKVYAFYSIRKAGVDQYGRAIRSWSQSNTSRNRPE